MQGSACPAIMVDGSARAIVRLSLRVCYGPNELLVLSYFALLCHQNLHRTSGQQRQVPGTINRHGSKDSWWLFVDNSIECAAMYRVYSLSR